MYSNQKTKKVPIFLNWGMIEEKYPKSFKKALDFFNIKLDSLDNFRFEDYYRNLFNFFDEQKIYISITRSNYEKFSFETYIHNNNVNIGYSEICYKTRLQAEMAGFNKAFEILENY